MPLRVAAENNNFEIVDFLFKQPNVIFDMYTFSKSDRLKIIELPLSIKEIDDK